MKRAEKNQVVKAARTLARGYRNNENDHRFDTCPLCKLFYDDNNPSRLACSQNCPNMAFMNEKGYNNHGCMQRQDDHENLNWNVDGGNERLSKFWTRVGNYLTKQKPEDVENLGESLRIKAHIVSLAKEFDKEN